MVPDWAILNPSLLQMRRDNLSQLEALEASATTPVVNYIRYQTPASVRVTWGVDTENTDDLNAWLEAGNRFRIQPYPGNYVRFGALDAAGNPKGLTAIVRIDPEADFWRYSTLIFGIATAGISEFATGISTVQTAQAADQGNAAGVVTGGIKAYSGISSQSESATMFEFEGDEVIALGDTSESFSPVLFEDVGNEIPIFSDAQVIDYGFDPGLTDVSALNIDAGYNAESYFGYDNFVVNGTLETPVNDFGVVDYFYKPATSFIAQSAVTAAVKKQPTNTSTQKANTPQTLKSATQTLGGFNDILVQLGRAQNNLQKLSKPDTRPVQTEGQLRAMPKQQSGGSNPLFLVGVAAVAGLIIWKLAK